MFFYVMSHHTESYHVVFCHVMFKQLQFPILRGSFYTLHFIIAFFYHFMRVVFLIDSIISYCVVLQLNMLYYIM